MKKIFKVVVFLIAFIIIICATAFATFTIQGHKMYKESIQEKSLEARVDDLRNKKGYVSIEDIPIDFQNAVIAVEDHRYRSHGAVDFISIFRAITINIVKFDLTQGGSTITQQLSKNLFFTQEQNFERKMAEVFAAIEMEKVYSKDDILEMYMNNNYYGDGFYGIGSAAKGYYDKEPQDLTLYEMTMLAGLPNAPGVYSPVTNPTLARERQIRVIDAMYRYRIYFKRTDGRVNGKLAKKCRIGRKHAPLQNLTIYRTYSLRMANYIQYLNHLIYFSYFFILSFINSISSSASSLTNSGIPFSASFIPFNSTLYSSILSHDLLFSSNIPNCSNIEFDVSSIKGFIKTATVRKFSTKWYITDASFSFSPSSFASTQGAVSSTYLLLLEIILNISSNALASSKLSIFSSNNLICF